jgi:hypothetical protein
MRGFEWMAWVPILLLTHAAMAASSPESDQCKLKRYATVEFTVLQDKILVPVMIQNRAAFMQLHTVTGASVMWLSAAHDFGVDLRLLKGSGVRFGSQSVTQYAEVKPLGLGGLRFSKAELLLVQAPRGWDGALNGIPVVGALGMDFFAKVDVELDFRINNLILYSQDHCSGRVVYWTDTYATTPLTRGPLGNAYFPMELDGKRIEATLDSTRTQTTLTTDVTKRLFGFDEHSADIETSQNGDGHADSQYRAMALTAPGLSVNNARVQLLPRPSNCTLTIGFGRNAVAQYSDCIGAEAPLRLGMDVISKLHLYFATKENVLYFTAADAGSTAPGMPESGSGH